MTNATKTLGVIFAVLVLISAMLEIGEGPEASKAFRTEIVKADTSRVNRVEIQTPTSASPIQLFEQEGDWKVKKGGGQAYPADKNAIRNILGQLKQLEANALITRDKEDFTRYKVDSTGTIVTLKEGDQVLDKLYVGAPQMVSRRQFNNYVRPGDRNEVYSVEGYLKPRFDKSVEDWRDKTVWSLSTDRVSRVDFVFPGDSSYSIQRKGESHWVSNGDSLKAAETRSVVNQLANLNANGFAEQVSKQNFGPELYAVNLQLQNGEQRKLRIKQDPAEKGTYRVVASGYPYVFTVSKSTWDSSVFKDRAALIVDK